MTHYELVRACSLLLLSGQVLHCPRPWATAHRTDVAWRDGEGRLRLTKGRCAFDAAAEYVRRVGVEKARRSLRVRWCATPG